MKSNNAKVRVIVQPTVILSKSVTLVEEIVLSCFGSIPVELVLQAQCNAGLCMKMRIMKRPWQCTGAVVGQQPFGEASASGTNDKAGSIAICYHFVVRGALRGALAAWRNSLTRLRVACANSWC